jgi:hypothetical protein
VLRRGEGVHGDQSVVDCEARPSTFAMQAAEAMRGTEIAAAVDFL